MAKMNWDRAKTRDTIRQLDREDRERESARRHRRTGPNGRNAEHHSALLAAYGRVGVEHAARLVIDLQSYTGTNTYLLSLKGQANVFTSEPWWPSVRQYVCLAKALGEEAVPRINGSECSAPATPSRSSFPSRSQRPSTRKVRHEKGSPDHEEAVRIRRALEAYTGSDGWLKWLQSTMLPDPAWLPAQKEGVAIMRKIDGGD